MLSSTTLTSAPSVSTISKRTPSNAPFPILPISSVSRSHRIWRHSWPASVVRSKSGTSRPLLCREKSNRTALQTWVKLFIPRIPRYWLPWATRNVWCTTVAVSTSYWRWTSTASVTWTNWPSRQTATNSPFSKINDQLFMIWLPWNLLNDSTRNKN